MKKIKVYFIGLSIAFLAFVGYAFTPDYFEISKQLDIFSNVFKEVNLYYVDETEPGELMEEAITEMLSSLDPYTNYIPEERVEDFKIQTTGNYGGIGAGIRKFKNKLIITATYEGFAAANADLRAGDIILKIDGKSVDGKSSSEVSDILKGSPGTTVEISIERAGVLIDKSVKRQKVHLNSVPYFTMLEDSIAYVSLSSFTSSASKEIKNALEQLEDEKGIKSIVLDLRSNPGGLLSEAVNVTNLFIDKNLEVVKTKGKLEEWEKSYKTLNRAFNSDVPLAVLIDRGSASASEIVSGTIQDYDRGIVIGQRSFGKGLVQQTRKLSYGAQIKVTIAKYYTPSGRCIQAINYAERAEDGSVKAIPDSLRNEFLTQNGRKVFDGGGVDPDIKVEDGTYSNLSFSLFTNMLIFDYATLYAAEHESIDQADMFVLKDEEYAKFEKWLSDKEYEYTTGTELKIQELLKAAENDDYSQELSDELKKLEKKYAEVEADDLQTHKAEIKKLLEQEIASRYYFEEGRIAAGLKGDAALTTAIEILKDKEKYQMILSGPKN